MELGVMTIKGYSTLPRSQELESPLQIQFSVIAKPPSFGGGVERVHFFADDTFSVF